VGKDDDVPDGLAAGGDHGEPVDADADASGRRHAVFEGCQEILVRRLRFLVAGRPLAGPRLEAGPLVDRVYQLGKGVGYLLAGHQYLDPPGEARRVRVPPRQRRDFLGVVSDERRLDQLRFDQLLVQLVDYPARPGGRGHLDLAVSYTHLTLPTNREV